MQVLSVNANVADKGSIYVKMYSKKGHFLKGNSKSRGK